MDNSLNVIILTGGTSKRFGRDKSEALVEGRALVDHLISEIHDGTPIIVVGPARESFSAQIQVIQESPPMGGPVAAIAAGLALVQSDLVVIFATDMPFGAALIPQLLSTLGGDCDAVLPIDSAGFVQPLSALYRVKPLKAALSAMKNVTDESMRNLLTYLKVTKMVVDGASEYFLTDIDTQEDLRKAVSSYKGLSEPLTNEGR